MAYGKSEKKEKKNVAIRPGFVMFPPSPLSGATNQPINQTMKTIRVTLTDSELAKYNWTVSRVSAACNVGTNGKRRKVSGYAFTDHEGCERFVEGNWFDLVSRFRLTAENYGFTTNLS